MNKNFPGEQNMSEGLGIVMLMRQFYPRTGGYQNQALRLATELIKSGLRVQVVTQRFVTLAPFEVYQGIPIHRVFAFRSGPLAAWSYLVSAFVWMARNRDKFQIIHAHRSSSGLVAGVIGFLLRKRVLYKLTRGDEIQEKGLRSELIGRMKTACLRATVGKFISLTEETVQDLKQLGVPRERIAKIPNGIDFEDRMKRYDRGQIRAELSLAPDAKVVSFVGRLAPDKGVDWLLDIWKIVSQADREAHLLLIGDGPDREALKSRAKSLGIQDTVSFLGRQEDVYRFFAASDVFVLPSRLEGMSNALLEAMSQGLPVVTADDALGGNRSVVAHKQDGILVPLEDTQLFADSLLGLLKDRNFRLEMGNRARRKIEDAFSVQSVTRRYMEVYRELLGASC
jgi:glycosyltransferase involved in cell wall biosynthesis